MSGSPWDAIITAVGQVGAVNSGVWDMSAGDEHWMERALELAEQGRGYVEPNPLVGAVVVREGQFVGEGWHQRYGQAHAEVNALADAGIGAEDATLYVTLEPCCHHGKTPPCTDAVLRAGIRRVVAAMLDPFPAVGGKGVERLRAAGVAVEVGVGEARARRLNAPYLTLLEMGRPQVHAKWAMTLDGKIATRSGDSKWISNVVSRWRVHELRGRMDAIVVGMGTAVADNPQLTVRPPGPRTPTRIVLDSRGRLPPESFLAQTAGQTPTLLATTQAISSEAQRALEELGVRVLPLPAVDERVDVAALLAELGRQRMTNVLVEGGSAVLGSFLDAGLVDEVHVFVAPRLAGGTDARTPIGGRGIGSIAEALRLSECRCEELQGDFYLHGWR
jgi:diaminohydroxyphosphoribosylaminopyrimidine deaminase/5-amino-6-(5-phosphoribosylamino)uracil reductase